MRLLSNLTLLVVGYILAAFVLLTAAVALILAGVRSDLVDTRTLFAVQSLRGTIEANLTLGFPLAEIPVAQELIEREKLRDPRILLIDVFDANGTILFSTDRASVGEAASAELGAALKSPGAPWRLDRRRSAQLGATILNDFDQPAGGIAITTVIDSRFQRMIDTLAPVWAWALAHVAGFLVLALLVIALAVWPLLRFARSAETMAAALTGRTTPATPVNESGLVSLVMTAAAADQALGQAFISTQQLDDGL